MEPVVDIPDIESRVSNTSDIFSLDFSILISYLLKLRAFGMMNKPAINLFIELLDRENYSNSNWIRNDVYPFLLANTLQCFAQNIPTLSTLKTLFRDIKISTSTQSDDSIIYSISKALNLVIVKHDGRLKKEYYSGNSPSPMFVHIIWKNNLYYAAIHKTEILLDKSRNPQLLSEYPYVKLLKNYKVTDFDSDRRLLQRFREKFDKIAKYVSIDDKREIRQCLENFKTNNAGIYNENQQIINSVVASMEIATSCEKHKLVCFPCTTVHCFQCFSMNRHEKLCECREQVTEEFIKGNGLTIINPIINPGPQVLPPPSSSVYSLPTATILPTYYAPNPGYAPRVNVQEVTYSCYSCNKKLDIQNSNSCQDRHYICSDCYPFCNNICAVCYNYKCNICQHYVLESSRYVHENQIYHYLCLSNYFQQFQGNYT